MRVLNTRVIQVTEAVVQLPHLITLVDPLEIEDQYGIPAPALFYGPGAPRRDVRGYMQPQSSIEPAETGRQPVISHWRLFTDAIVGPREQIEWRGRTFRVDGMPEAWEPAFGRPRSWVRIVEVEG